ncbi:hypothetical protein [Nocardia sp. NPDC047038]|uniref:hypothetical protein n=1 Tax=Nocardia sp. NPDC047038 TaxID=3154338 RepID=UPI00340C547A
MVRINGVEVDVEDTTYTACWVPGTTDPRRYRVVNQVDSNGPTGYIEEHWRSDIRLYLVFDPMIDSSTRTG